MNDQDLRKRTDDQLDKLKSTTTLPEQYIRAVYYGQNGQFRYAGKGSS
jgi:hypothetical protein